MMMAMRILPFFLLTQSILKLNWLMAIPSSRMRAAKTGKDVGAGKNCSWMLDGNGKSIFYNKKRATNVTRVYGNFLDNTFLSIVFYGARPRLLHSYGFALVIVS